MQNNDNIDFANFDEGGESWAASNGDSMPGMQSQSNEQEDDPFQTVAGAAGGFVVPGQ
jgi:hypothetical protein